MGSGSSKKQITFLQKLNTNDIVDLVKNTNCLAKVIDCHDGDTCTIALIFNKTPVKISIRILGIDTAELPKRKDKSDRTPEEIELAEAARDFLISKVLNKCVWVELRGWDKYKGRVNANIYCIDNKGSPIGPSISEQLLAAHLAVVYTSGKKSTDWITFHTDWKAFCSKESNQK